MGGPATDQPQARGAAHEAVPDFVLGALKDDKQADFTKGSSPTARSSSSVAFGRELGGPQPAGAVHVAAARERIVGEGDSDDSRARDYPGALSHRGQWRRPSARQRGLPSRVLPVLSRHPPTGVVDFAHGDVAETFHWDGFDQVVVEADFAYGEDVTAWIHTWSSCTTTAARCPKSPPILFLN